MEHAIITGMLSMAIAAVLIIVILAIGQRMFYGIIGMARSLPLMTLIVNWQRRISFLITFKNNQMKKIWNFIVDFIYDCGWFAVVILVLAITVFILALSSIVTPFLNSIIWGM